MKKKRFIFTIQDGHNEFLRQESEKSTTSKSKVLSKILDTHIGKKEINVIRTYKKDFDPTDNISQTARTINDLLYHREYEALIQKVKFDFDLLVKETDLDFLLYLTSQLSDLYPDTPHLAIAQAKVLRQKGLLNESISAISLQTFGKDDFHKWILLAQISIAKGEIGSALGFLNKAQIELNIWTSVEDYQLRTEEFAITKSEYLWMAEGVNSALQHITALLSQEDCSPAVLGKAYCLKGDFLRDKGKYQDAEYSYRKGSKLLKKVPEGKYKARSLGGLGSVYKKKGDATNSAKYIFQALEISKQYKDTITTGSMLGSVGSLYQSLGELNLAKSSFQEKWEIGSRADSLREKFYANYDRIINLVATGEGNNAKKVLLSTSQDAVDFKRKYYLDIWDGYVLSFKDLASGLKIIETAKRSAQDSAETRQVDVANYVLGASLHFNSKLPNLKNKYFDEIKKDSLVSNQLKENVKQIEKGFKFILPI